MRTTETQNYRAWWLRTAIGDDPYDLTGTLLAASWETDYDLDRKARCQAAFIAAAASLVRDDEASAANWFWLRVRATNAERAWLLRQKPRPARPARQTRTGTHRSRTSRGSAADARWPAHARPGKPRSRSRQPDPRSLCRRALRRSAARAHHERSERLRFDRSSRRNRGLANQRERRQKTARRRGHPRDFRRWAASLVKFATCS